MFSSTNSFWLIIIRAFITDKLLAHYKIDVINICRWFSIITLQI